MMFSHSRPHSISSSRCSSTKSCRSIWSKIGKIFHRSSHSSSRSADFSRQTTGNYSNSTLSEASVKTVDIGEVDRTSSQRRHRKPLVVHEEPASQMLIPPFSPTYCKSNEFPYSNFYVKLPDGRWMIRYRDGNRDILRTDIMEGYMI